MNIQAWDNSLLLPSRARECVRALKCKNGVVRLLRDSKESIGNHVTPDAMVDSAGLIYKRRLSAGTPVLGLKNKSFLHIAYPAGSYQRGCARLELGWIFDHLNRKSKWGTSCTQRDGNRKIGKSSGNSGGVNWNVACSFSGKGIQPGIYKCGRGNGAFATKGEFNAT